MVFESNKVNVTLTTIQSRTILAHHMVLRSWCCQLVFLLLKHGIELASSSLIPLWKTSSPWGACLDWSDVFRRSRWWPSRHPLPARKLGCTHGTGTTLGIRYFSKSYLKKNAFLKRLFIPTWKKREIIYRGGIKSGLLELYPRFVATAIIIVVIIICRNNDQFLYTLPLFLYSFWVSEVILK